MTVLEVARPRPSRTPVARHAAPVAALRWSIPVVMALCCLQAWLALRAGATMSPFQDEGLYIYMGHRMISHLLHGTFLPEYPGAYFSGAPGFYPVLAALGDHAGGLRGARMVSTCFAVGATIGVNGLGAQLFGRLAGVLGAAAFVLCGSVIYQSDLATLDSATLCLVALAAWLCAASVRHDGFLWAPAVAVLLVLAFYAKYAGAAYTPVVAALAVALAATAERLVVLRRSAVMVLSALILGFFIFALWGQSLLAGIAVTTTSRTVLAPASTSSLIHQVLLWVGPWLALAVLGALCSPRNWATSAVLLAGSVVGPIQQIRIGESTSLAKHVAFGMVFAAPLVGCLLSRLLQHRPAPAAPVLLAALAGLGWHGQHFSHRFLTGWVDDRPLLPPLARLIAATPGRPILGEQPAAERYALRDRTAPGQWRDTYAFSYDHKSGPAAYREAIDQTSFGAIYLSKQPYFRLKDDSPTAGGAFVYRYLTTASTPYRPAGQIPQILHGKIVGHWYLFVPKVVSLPEVAGKLP